MGYVMGQKPMLTDKQAKALKPSDKPVFDGKVTGLLLTPTKSGCKWASPCDWQATQASARTLKSPSLKRRTCRSAIPLAGKKAFG